MMMYIWYNSVQIILDWPSLIDLEKVSALFGLTFALKWGLVTYVVKVPKMKENSMRACSALCVRLICEYQMNFKQILMIG